jgi:hypothetical protein
MSTAIKSGSDSTLAKVNPLNNALLVEQKGNAEIHFSHKDTTLDSFERLRVSEPRVVFEQNFGAVLTSSLTTLWESTATASGTQALTTNLYGLELNTLTTATSGYWIQAYNHIRYAPGVSTIFRATFNFNDLITNVRQRIGMFTDQGTYPSTAGDGLYLEADGSTVSVVRRSMTVGGAGAEERITQVNWNLNKMQGGGDIADPTQNIVTLDWTKMQHLVVEFQWLGAGTIRFGFETGSAGTVWVHEIVSVNALSTTWSRTGSLPVRAEIVSNGVLAQAGKFTIVNCTVIQEGDVAEYRGWRYFNGNSGATLKVGGVTANTLYPILSLRAASTNDLAKRARIVPTSLSITVAVAATTSTALTVALLMLPTPNTGATFGVTPAGSVTTVDQAATAGTAVTGTPIWGVIIPNVIGTYTFDLTGMKDNINVIGYNAAGTVAITGPSVLALAAGPLQTAGVGASIAASINWKELV